MISVTAILRIVCYDEFMYRDSRRPNLKKKLKSLGAVTYDLMLPETQAIPSVIDPNEDIIGLVYGRYKDDRENTVSRGVLIATDSRVVLLNKKPMFEQSDEFEYRVISGVDFSEVGIMGTVTLHTRMGDIHVRTFNKRCADRFVAALESKLFNAKEHATIKV